MKIADTPSISGAILPIKRAMGSRKGKIAYINLESK